MNDKWSIEEIAKNPKLRPAIDIARRSLKGSDDEKELLPRVKEVIRIHIDRIRFWI